MEFRTKNDYDLIISKIQELVSMFETHSTRNNKYKLYLSSGKVVTYVMTYNNIAHLLGVNVETIKNKYCPNVSSIEALRYLINNSYNIYKNIQNKELDYSHIFSPYIDDKLQIFEQQLNIMNDIEEIEFVCEFDSSKCYMEGGLIEYNANYYIAKKNRDGDLIILGLIKKGNSISYPQTSQLIKKEDMERCNLSESKLGKLLKNQVISFLGTVRTENEVTNYRKETHLNIDPKANALQTLKFYSLKYGAVPCTIHQHIFDLKCVNGNREEVIKTKNDLLQLSEFMKERQIIDISQFEEPISEVSDLVNTYNDVITQGNYSEEARHTYSNLLREYQQLRMIVESLKEEMATLEAEKSELLKQHQKDEIIKEDYENLRKNLFEIVDKEKQKSL